MNLDDSESPANPPAVPSTDTTHDSAASGNQDVEPTVPTRLTVSIIIPTYNRTGLLEEAIRSALSQTRVPEEIVVVDDGSTDNTQEVLRQFGPPVVVLRQPNRRLSAARNLAMQVARGDVFLYLDSDDLLLPNCVERVVQTLEDHSDVDVVYCDCYLIDVHGKQLGVFSQVEPGIRPSGMILGQLGYRWFVINPSSTAVRRSALGDIEFDGGLSCTAEDFEFWRRLARRSRFQYIDEILASYRYHDAQISTRVPELIDGAIEVQRRIMNMPEFRSFTRGDRARLFCLHGVKHAGRGRCREARRFFLRSFLASPVYLPGPALLLVGLFGLRPLQSVLEVRRRMLRKRVAAKSARPPGDATPSQVAAETCLPATSTNPIQLAP